MCMQRCHVACVAHHKIVMKLTRFSILMLVGSQSYIFCVSFCVELIITECNAHYCIAQKCVVYSLGNIQKKERHK